VSRSFVLSLAIWMWSLPAAAQVPTSEYAARRAHVAGHMGDGVLLALGAREPTEDYLSFVQAPSFYYLTGFTEPDAALVIAKRGAVVTPILFVQPRDPAREVWTGTRLGPAGATRRTGIPARAIDALGPVLDSLLAITPKLYVVGDLSEEPVRSPNRQYVDALVERHPGLAPVDVNPVVERLRSRKSPAELALIEKAAAITALAQREAMRAIRPGMNEFEIQALIEYTFRRNGADRPSFATIVGSGPNSTTLHYSADDRFMNAGEVVVMDIGASYRGYAADVTRTVPVSGTFSPEQREIYQLVRAVQAAAERQAVLGAPAQRMEDSSEAVLAVGLTRLGLIQSPDAVFDAPPGTCPRPRPGGCAQLALYYMHGLGHGIGLDVHDPEQWYYPPQRIEPGSAFTIEPGVYVRANLFEGLPDTPRNRAMIAAIAPAVDKYKNIGVRIEDDYVATDTGVVWISRAPRELAEVEAALRAQGPPIPRDTIMINWYRTTAPR
jgi:Xaa-Pro aminopeptidase